MTDLHSLGLFDVVVADPPWRSDFGKTCSRATERHYPTLTLDELAEIQVPALPYSLLVMWATAPCLRQALALMEAWGFTYRTSGVWRKDKAGTGKWLRSQHELFLLGRRGKFPAPKPGTLPLSVIDAPRGRHSQKPEALQDALESTYPGLRYLEMFARRQRPGWTCWGNDPEVSGVAA